MNTLNAVLCNKLFMPHNCINDNRKYNLLMNLPMQSVRAAITGGLENSLRNGTNRPRQAVASEWMQDDRKMFRERM